VAFPFQPVCASQTHSAAVRFAQHRVVYVQLVGSSERVTFQSAGMEGATGEPHITAHKFSTFREQQRRKVYLPGFCTTSICRVFIKIFRSPDLTYTTRMPLALYWKTLVYVSSTSQKIEELGPKSTPLPRTFKSRRISDEDETIPCSRNEYVETLRRAHEPNDVERIRATETRDYYVTLFTLVIICGSSND